MLVTIGDIMDKHDKKTFVTSLRSALETAGLVVVTRQTALTVAESTDLRVKMRDAGGSFKIAKNTLARLAVKDLPCEEISEHLTGPTGLSYSQDPVAAAKIVAEFSKKNGKMEIVCGALGNKFLDANAIQELAKLPSLDELRGRLVGLVMAPATKIAGVAQAPASQLARVISAYAAK